MSAISPTAIHLTPQQMRELAEARAAHKYVRRAITVATFDGWTIAVFGIASCLCGIGDIPSMVVGLGLGGLAYIELRGAAQLRRLEQSAPRRLGFNQILLGTLLAMYSIWKIYQELHGPSPFNMLSQADPHMGKKFEDMAHSLSIAIYGCLIIFAVIAQGGAALFYFTREKYLRDYRQRTPAWILQMQKSGVMV